MEDLFESILEEEKAKAGVTEEVEDVDTEPTEDAEEESTEEVETEEEEITEDNEEENVSKEASETKETTEEDITEDDVEETEGKPTFDAFAEMRVRTKEAEKKAQELESKIKGFDELAVSLGYKDYNDLLEAGKNKTLEQEAKQQNVPVEVLKELKQTRLEVEKLKQDKELIIQEEKEAAVLHAIEQFTDKHKLSEDKFKSVLKDMGSDGFDINFMMEMPQKALSRLLNSYLDNEVLRQKEIAKKEKIKREVPTNPTDDKIDSSTQIDELVDVFTKGKMDGYDY